MKLGACSNMRPNWSTSARSRRSFCTLRVTSVVMLRKPQIVLASSRTGVYENVQ